MEYSELYGLAGFPVVAALVQVLKPWFGDERWHPVLAIVIGIIINIAIAYQVQTDYVLAMLTGVVTGLAASGLYSGQRAVRGQ